MGLQNQYHIWTTASIITFITFTSHYSSTVSVTAPNSVIRRSYQESCNKTTKCDSRAWLGCFQKQCDCIKPDEMVYDEQIGKCVSKSGERCTFAVDDDEDYNFILEVAACVSNARCGLGGVCECDSKFYEDSSGTCTPALGHLQPCQTEAQCSRYQALHCQTQSKDEEQDQSRSQNQNQNQSQALIKSKGPNQSKGPKQAQVPIIVIEEKFCRCNESISVYFEDNDNDHDNGNVNYVKDPQCVGLAGYPCINSKCTKNAICENEKNTCLCTEEFYPDEEGKCIKKIEPLKNCTASFQCEQKPGQKFVCLNGLCNCDPGSSTLSVAKPAIKYSDIHGYSYHSHSHGSNFQEENQNFHGFDSPTLFQCVGLASFPCIDKLCARNAYCAYSMYQDQDQDQGTCKCQPDYTQSKFHTCAMGYEKPCSTSSTCIDELVCRNSQCLCPFKTQTFDTIRRTCLNLVGGPCNSSLSCELRAECKILNVKGEGSITGPRPGPGHCVCKDGYVENLEGKCEAGYDTECSRAEDCDSIAALQCVNKKCKCPEFAEFNPSLRKCVGLVGAKCDLEKENECTENSRCVQVSPFKIPGNCTCDHGFQETSNYTCAAVVEGVEDTNEL